jgi:hypothetical protein
MMSHTQGYQKPAPFLDPDQPLQTPTFTRIRAASVLPEDWRASLNCGAKQAKISKLQKTKIFAILRLAKGSVEFYAR